MHKAMAVDPYGVSEMALTVGTLSVPTAQPNESFQTSSSTIVSPRALSDNKARGMNSSIESVQSNGEEMSFSMNPDDYVIGPAVGMMSRWWPCAD